MYHHHHLLLLLDRRHAQTLVGNLNARLEGIETGKVFEKRPTLKLPEWLQDLTARLEVSLII
jgi:hypothetical protein